MLIDTSHWYEGPPTALAIAANRLKLSTEEMFSIDSPVSAAALKRRLREMEILPYNCSLCGIHNWREQPLSLQIDHVNGQNRDWRLENLRWLCPNCHSQTETWGRAVNLDRKTDVNKQSASARYLAQASDGLQPHRLRPRKWTLEQLPEAVKLSTNLTQVCRQLGLRATRDNYLLLAEWINHLDLDRSHWLYGKKKSIEDLVKRGHLRRRLLTDGLLEEKCYDCGIREWMGRPLLVQLHHKNGQGKDNRLENLTFFVSELPLSNGQLRWS